MAKARTSKTGRARPRRPALAALARDELGAGAVEYALIAALISMVVVAGAVVFGVNLGELFLRLGGFFQGAEGGVPPTPFGS